MFKARGRLRAAVARRRHRRLDAVFGELDERIRTSEQTVSARLDGMVNVQRAQADRLNRDIGFKAPALWNELHRSLDPPLPPASALLAKGASAAAAVVREKVALRADAQRVGLEELGVDRIIERVQADTNPLPTPADRVRYSGDDHLAYWISGLGDAVWLEAVAERHGVTLAGGRLLDFGCASGRVLRHFAAQGRGTHLLGVDIQPQAVRWARMHLSGLTVALTTIIPALPLTDTLRRPALRWVSLHSHRRL